MNIKILQEYLKLCEDIGATGTPQGFYMYVEGNYTNEVKRLNMNLITKLWGNV